jgi:hypothetical protein
VNSEAASASSRRPTLVGALLYRRVPLLLMSALALWTAIILLLIEAASLAAAEW